MTWNTRFLGLFRLIIATCLRFEAMWCTSREPLWTVRWDGFLWWWRGRWAKFRWWQRWFDRWFLWWWWMDLVITIVWSWWSRWVRGWCMWWVWLDRFVHCQWVWWWCLGSCYGPFIWWLEFYMNIFMKWFYVNPVSNHFPPFLRDDYITPIM